MTTVAPAQEGITASEIHDSLYGEGNDGFLSPKQIQALMQFSPAVDRPTVFRKKDTGLGRTLLLTPTEKFLLLTSTKNGDVVLGEGSFKKAKFAIDLETGEKHVVAICRKSALKSPQDWEIVRKEIEAMEALKGQKCVIQIITSVMTDDKCYIVMDYGKVGTLFDAIARQKLSLNARVQIARDCAQGLKNIHEAGHIHRDIKSENIFLFFDSKQNVRAKIGDLGRACKEDDKAYMRKLCGSPIWVPPEKAPLFFQPDASEEVLEAVATPAGDIWSLGLVFYNMFHPCGWGLSFQEAESKEEALTAIANLDQTKLTTELYQSGIDQRVLPLIERMLRVNPAERPTIDEVQQAIAQIR